MKTQVDLSKKSRRTHSHIIHKNTPLFLKEVSKQEQKVFHKLELDGQLERIDHTKIVIGNLYGNQRNFINLKYHKLR